MGEQVAAPRQVETLRAGELAALTGVSVQTIHYYLREGLLSAPLKTARNMAYYGQEHVEDIRLIRMLQSTRHLPLAVIKLILEAKRSGQDVSHLQDMRLTFETLFRPLDAGDQLESVTFAELIALTSLPGPLLENLEEGGLLTPMGAPATKRYDELDVRIARAVRTLLDHGLTAADLTVYSEFVRTLRAEVQLVRNKVFPHLGRGSTVSVGDIKATLDDLKASLTIKVYREGAINLDRTPFTGRQP